MQEVQVRTTTIHHEKSEGILLLRRKKIIHQLRQEQEGISHAATQQLKEELLLIDAELDHMRGKHSSAKAREERNTNVLPLASALSQKEYEKSYRNAVIKRIQQYVKIVADQKILEAKIADFSQSMHTAETPVTARYGEGGGGSSDGRYSVVERAVLDSYNALSSLRSQFYQNFSIIAEMEIALNELSQNERDVIEAKFMASAKDQKTDIANFMSLHLTKTRYYAHCRSGIEKLARALFII